MKQSKILKIISYVGLMILVPILILSIFIVSAKENPRYNEKEYFNTQVFTQDYMNFLQVGMFELIHNNDSIYSIQDGDKELHFFTSIDYYFDVKDRYYLIIYQDKVLTNVELTNTTNTVENIKQYIKNNENSKEVNIINGEIQTDSEIIQKVGIQYINDLTETYYTRNGDMKTYITAKAEDFEIYSSYVEEFKEETEIGTVNNILQKLEPFEPYSYYMIPISSILILLILIYLTIAIGHKKRSRWNSSK